MLETVSHIYGNLDWSTKFNVNNMSGGDPVKNFAETFLNMMN